jgi:hypothetical protein
MENLSKILFILLFLSGCSLTSYYVDPVYEDYTEEVYYYNDSIYFGYYSGYYYYYGIPHYWPWWYYYTYRPATHYYIHTHVHINCPNGSFVYAYGNRKFNNKKLKCTKDSWDNKLYRPQTSRWVLPDNKIQYNKNNKYNINKQNYNINKTNYNRIFNKSFNTTNKVNNGSTRPNKTSTTRRSKR